MKLKVEGVRIDEGGTWLGGRWSEIVKIGTRANYKVSTMRLSRIWRLSRASLAAIMMKYCNSKSTRSSLLKHSRNKLKLAIGDVGVTPSSFLDILTFVISGFSSEYCFASFHVFFFLHPSTLL